MAGSETGVLEVRKRDGGTVEFEASRIGRAIEQAMRAELEVPAGQPLDEPLAEQVRQMTEHVVTEVRRDTPAGQPLEVERIQDAVEHELMRRGRYAVARRYIVYREQRARARQLRGDSPAARPRLNVRLADGTTQPLDAHHVKRTLYEACEGLDACEPDALIDPVLGSIYDGITQSELERAMILAVRSRIEQEPAWNRAAVRLLLNVIHREALGGDGERASDATYRERFADYLQEGVDAERLDPRLLNFDTDRLAAALAPQRDEAFTYLGLQTVYDRYLLHIDGRRIETPQYFWMRVAMGLAVEEADPTGRAIAFYELLSTFRFVSATPTLFNAGTRHPQLSSCYLSTVQDDLSGIFKAVGDNARLSKWAGGLGNDWTPVRATGARIRGTNGESQGIIPFLKIVSDTAVAVNQGGKRKGAVCAYLETWHLDLEEFLELRKNTGDDRRRTHDMHTANWIPDLFMKRVRDRGEWTLFSPDEVGDLHDLYGEAFERRYAEYEAMADRGELRQHRRVDAMTLWQKMLAMLFETGHPWITFKDPSNIRSAQDHAGVVHNSNLCTEILLNTSGDETAVCNLGSVNLAAHTTPAGLDAAALDETVRTAVRMLDNVVDINFYPTAEAERANRRHRPIGLGMMGFQDALFALRIPFASDAAVTFADRSMERISYGAILASSELAAERGCYSSYTGSKWDRGLLPIDTLDLLERERGEPIETDRSTTLDWQHVRDHVARHGMRNSHVTAIAPTATISNIAGCSQSIEPIYRNLFAKSNLSGEFTIVNDHLVADLKQRGLWDEQMLEDLKVANGSVQPIERVPAELKELYRTAAEIEPNWLIEAAARRQKWLDMGQSLNLYIDRPLGRLLHEMYFLAWRKGLKTTYYLRSVAATHIEKSSVDMTRRRGESWIRSASAATPSTGEACGLDDPTCEACQ